MARAKYIVQPGETYNWLTVIQPAGKDKHGKKLWLCQCKCGGQTTLMPYTIIRGHIKSCGCWGRGKIAPNIIIVKPGDVYHKLTAVERTVNNKFGCQQWIWQCVCGKTTTAPVRAVKSGNTKSCGCGRPPTLRGVSGFTHKNQPNDPLALAKRAWRDRYRDGGIPFEEFLRLSQEPCHYCGKSRVGSMCFSYNPNRRWEYNGLDRLDPTRGHTIDNVVPCCKICNFGKDELQYQEFLDWVSLVYHHVVEPNQKALAEARDTHGAQYYQTSQGKSH